MGLMTVFAVVSGHVTGVGLVTLGTLRNLAMYIMAERTIQRGMLAPVFPELLDLGAVAGETGVGYVAAKGNVLGSMRVLVARETSRKLVVRLVGMAHAALGDRPFDRGGVPDVAIQAGYACFVGSACRCDVCGRLGVALDAVRIDKRCRG